MPLHLDPLPASADLDAYFARIGYAGPRTPTVDTLRALHAAHPAAIPFENLDPLLGRPVRLDRGSLQQKLVQERRGGYCYEQNLLFAHVLASLGFQLHGLAARVVWGAPAGAVRPRTHMLLRVEIGRASWIADVGFGGLTLTAPLRLEMGSEQPTPHETFRLSQDEGEFLLQAYVGEAWGTLYRFGLEEHTLPDYEVANWYTAAHPDSRFVSSLLAARALPRRRLALVDGQLAVHEADGTTSRRSLATGGAIALALQDEFGITLPADARLHARLDELARKNRS